MTTDDPGTRPAALARLILATLPAADGPVVLGVSGLQGSGKSTLADALVRAARAGGVTAVGLSLDDFYLTRGERSRLARDVHPLLATRGVPGTHDLGLMLDTLRALVDPSTPRPFRLPRFDKGRDDRAPRHEGPCVDTPPRLVVFEGWCLGVQPQAPGNLAAPVNALESNEDGDGRWRRYANDQLARYQAAWRCIDRLVVLLAPSWDIVRQWRGEAEPARDATTPHAMDGHALDRFLAHYERLSRHALATLPDRADLLVELDTARQPVRITPR